MEIPKEPKRLEDNIALWSEFKDLAVKYECLSLGEGAPAYQPPKFLRDEMIKAIDEGHN
jgi:aspartate/methionine/tyrosine aminotransferase